MLPRAAYFKVLASLGNIQTPEWCATVAGLVTLRLVDDWFDFGPFNQESHQEDLQIVRVLIAKVPHVYLLQPILEQIVIAVERAEQVTTQAVAPPMLAYAESLECDGKLVLAQDVLLPLRIQAERTNDMKTTIRTASRLGFIFRTLSQWDLAIENYDRSIYYAGKVGDSITALEVTMGKAKIVSAFGNLEHAREIAEGVMHRAENLASSRLLLTTLHDLAYFATLQYDYQTAIPLYYRAMEYVTNERRSHERIMADLADTTLEIADLTTSWRLYLQLALTAREQLVRWQATISLMRIAALEQQAENFELYRSALQLAPLTPWLTMGYRYYSAAGYRAFGNEIGAQEEHRKARATAKQHGIHVSYAG